MKQAREKELFTSIQLLIVEQKQEIDRLKDALSDALDCVEVTRNWLAADEGEGCADAAKVCDECLAYAASLGVVPTSKQENHDPKL